MNTKVFDNTEYENARDEHMQEAKERWGDTKAYQEYLDKTKDMPDKKMQDAAVQLDMIFAEFAECMKSGIDFSDCKEQQIAEKIQRHILEN